ncbi:rRNA (cytosine-C(5))-methyltransferase NOP2C isoform X3 [Malania oleifera]|uniref:rRNA (cytosine-C(5))-methyltransferase NOP2C isoform X3 n=1 Tax=Malania oleifera TaxID=397392 RepID=UPI0025AE4CA5|nr:rRNA (cytosine-C(5))-methyltransferase NOP2C isoform X3 [Malania oleifera]
MKRGRDLIAAVRRSFLSLRTPSPMMDASERYSYNPTLRWNPEVEDYFVKAYGTDNFSRITKALMCPSRYSCIRVNTLKSTSDAVIEKLWAIIQETGLGNAVDSINLDKCDAISKSDVSQNQRNFPEESSFCKNSHDSENAVLGLSEDLYPWKESLPTGPIVKCHLPGLDYVVFVRGSGPHTIDYGYAHERPLKEVIVSRKCAEAVLRGAQVYVPGILACSAHVEKGDPVAVSVAVEQPGLDGGWSIGITRGTVLQGFETDPHYFERKGLYIGHGTAMMSRAGFFRVSEGLAVDMSNRVFKLASFHDVLEGEIFLQNLPSVIAAHALDPQQGERILDMCAAPGGKTTAIAILMKDEGEVVAVDRSHNKVLDIQKLAAEMGLNCITTYKLDALRAVCHGMGEPIQSAESNTIGRSNADLSCVVNEFSLSLQKQMVTGNGARENQQSCGSKAEAQVNIRRMRNGPGRNHCMGGRVESSKGFSPNSFDRVLLDAPCSALGLRPRLFAGEETVVSLRNHANYQKRMFDQAIQLVRPGGVLVYSTCTINPGENEALVRYALDTYKFLSLASQHPRIGGPGLVGSCSFSDGYVEEWLKPGEDALVQRFDPSSTLDTIGFFIAKFNVGPKDT